MLKHGKIIYYQFEAIRFQLTAKIQYQALSSSMYFL